MELIGEFDDNMLCLHLLIKMGAISNIYVVRTLTGADRFSIFIYVYWQHYMVSTKK